jgi:Xaa-Pro aminopeptidase
MTRTIITGKPNQKQQLIYGIVKESQAVGLENVKPGLIWKK